MIIEEFVNENDGEKDISIKNVGMLFEDGEYGFVVNWGGFVEEDGGFFVVDGDVGSGIFLDWVWRSKNILIMMVFFVGYVRVYFGCGGFV